MRKQKNTVKTNSRGMSSILKTKFERESVDYQIYLKGLTKL